MKIKTAGDLIYGPQAKRGLGWKGEIDGLWTSVGANEVSFFFYFLLKNFLRLRNKK